MATTLPPVISEHGVAKAEDYRRQRDTAVLSIVFSDIAGSTPLLEDLGDERFHTLRTEHREQMAEIVEKDKGGKRPGQKGSPATAW